tara:strand:+ start:418 stop:1125 length:708 start_codon:yes stop_codon:yes gene_type:complete
MFLTSEKKKHNSWQGTFYTRKWNDHTSIAYFEKSYGGKPLLKKINQIAVQNNLIFNSSMVDENSSEIWRASGWEMVQRLNVLSLNLKHVQSSDEKVVNVKKFTNENISEVINLDHKIFEPYWQNSTAAFSETISSCTHNYLFVQKKDNNPIGYGILGITRSYGFLQRFGINKEFQQRGFGKKLLDEVIKFSKQKKLVNIRLNTQEQNKHAKSLYLNSGFKITNINYIILGTSNTK